MRVIVLLLIVMSLSQCAPKSEIMTESEFAREYINALQKKYPQISFSLQGDFSIIGTKGNEKVKFNLENMYHAYKAEPASLKQIIDHYLTVSERGFAERKVSMANIIPVIKPVEYLDGIRESLGQGKTDPVGLINEKYNDQLIIVYAQDSETSIEYLNEKTFKGLGISMDSLRSAAISNLQRVVSNVSRDGDKGLYLIGTQGGYQTSVILLSSVWTKEALPVDGDWVIGMPTRDVLLVTGSKNKDGIAKIKEMTAKIYKENNYQVSTELFRWNGKKFELYRN